MAAQSKRKPSRGKVKPKTQQISMLLPAQKTQSSPQCDHRQRRQQSVLIFIRDSLRCFHPPPATIVSLAFIRHINGPKLQPQPPRVKLRGGCGLYETVRCSRDGLLFRFRFSGSSLLQSVQSPIYRIQAPHDFVVAFFVLDLDQRRHRNAPLKNDALAVRSNHLFRYFFIKLSVSPDLTSAIQTSRPGRLWSYY